MKHSIQIAHSVLEQTKTVYDYLLGHLYNFRANENVPFFSRICLSYSLKANLIIDMNANKLADTILSWDTNDELSDEEIFSGAIRDKEEVSPANIDIDSDSSAGCFIIKATVF